MTRSIPQAEDFGSELIFTTSRSSGPGGQNVNKVNTKVTLKLDIQRSGALTDEQKTMMINKLSRRLTNEGILIITAQEKRSQLQNKEEAINKFNALLVKIFTPKKKRKATKPGAAAKKARIKEKKIRSEKKQWRQKPSE